MKIVKLIVASLICLPTLLMAKPEFIVRPQTSFGHLSAINSHEDNGVVYSAGLRLLMSSSKTQRFGINVNYYDVQNDNNDSFTSAGFILEQKVANWFAMGVGTVINFNYGDDNKNIGGITTNLGWEPSWKKRVKPYVTYKTDFIFADNFILINSLDLGISLGF